MAILVTPDSRVAVVGLTGSQARFDLSSMLSLGTKVVCGIAPGREGTKVEGIPIFGTAIAAAREAPFDAVSVYVPPAAYLDTMVALIDVQPKWIQVVTEGVDPHDAMRVYRWGASRGVKIIGPGSNGIFSPGIGKVGMMGSPRQPVERGGVGVISRSGGMAQELSRLISRAGLGISTAVSIGGESILGLDFADVAAMFEHDPDTLAIAIYTEAGPAVESPLIQVMNEGDLSKPIVAIVTGDYLEDYERGASFGHAGSFLEGRETVASAKRSALQSAGINVASNTGDLVDQLMTAMVRV